MTIGNEKMKERGKNSRKKTGLFAGAALLLMITVIVVVFSGYEEETGILKNLRSESGYIRTVGSEEYEFFEQLIKRDLEEEVSSEELERLTKEKINRSNAEFLLANQMGLCKPYSFESFQLDMEHENTQRKIKKERNEVFYGPEQFQLLSYYVYIEGNLKLDMVSFITSNADKEVLEGAKTYFEENKEKYRTIEKIEYSITENGKTEQKSMLYEDMSTMEKTDSQLFEFLYSGKVGDELQYVYREQQRTVRVESVKYEKLNYANNAERVMRDYITNVYLENWLQDIEEKSPVEFNI